MFEENDLDERLVALWHSGTNCSRICFVIIFQLEWDVVAIVRALLYCFTSGCTEPCGV